MEASWWGLLHVCISWKKGAHSCHFSHFENRKKGWQEKNKKIRAHQQDWYFGTLSVTLVSCSICWVRMSIVSECWNVNIRGKQKICIKLNFPRIFLLPRFFFENYLKTSKSIFGVDRTDCFFSLTCTLFIFKSFFQSHFLPLREWVAHSESTEPCCSKLALRGQQVRLINGLGCSNLQRAYPKWAQKKHPLLHCTQLNTLLLPFRSLSVSVEGCVGREASKLQLVMVVKRVL